MKRNRMVSLFLLLCVLATGLPAAAENTLDSIGTVPNTTVYKGSWRNAYMQILNEYIEGIHLFQEREIEMTMDGMEYQIPCLPVGLDDLTGDGVPELLFLSLTGEELVDLYVFSGNSASSRCVLYVADILQPDYDPLLGFDIYLSSSGGDTLVIEHYQYEMPRVLQFRVEQKKKFTPLTVLILEGDFSGEGEDRYFRNGKEISQKSYDSTLRTLRKSRTRTVSSYLRDDSSGYGFDYTWDDAVNALGGSGDWDGGTSEKTGEKEIYGLAIQKLATRKGPGTTYEGGGTYEVKGEYIRVLAKAWDKRNEIWWVKCVIPYRKEERILWTGYKRFDKTTLSLDDLPEEFW